MTCIILVEHLAFLYCTYLYDNRGNIDYLYYLYDNHLPIDALFCPMMEVK